MADARLARLPSLGGCRLELEPICCDAFTSQVFFLAAEQAAESVVVTTLAANSASPPAPSESSSGASESGPVKAIVCERRRLRFRVFTGLPIFSYP